ncbi:MAG: hypothetical protein M3M85_02235 [bacterium]|nr:hypothetical protein [bacterium]
MKTILHGHSINNGLVTANEILGLLNLPCEGIELDIRSRGGIPVVVHDAKDLEYGEPLSKLLPVIAASGKMLFIELKEYNRDLWNAIVLSVEEHHLESRTILFAFPGVARKFPWQEGRVVSLGIIEPFPWRINKILKTLRPEMIMIGWGSNWEKLTFGLERTIFKIIWRILTRFSKPQDLPVKIVVGSLHTEKDLAWATGQRIFFANICDRACLESSL